MSSAASDLISGREAARELAEIGLTRRQSCRVLAAGLAGVPVRTSSALLYEGGRVQALTARPVATDAQLDALCPNGLFVARRDVDVSRSESERRALLEPRWAFSFWTAFLIGAKVELHGPFPFVSTVCSFVTTGADLMGATAEAEGYRLNLRPPGPWFDSLRERRVSSGPGRAWVVRGWQPYAGGHRGWGTIAS